MTTDTLSIVHSIIYLYLKTLIFNIFLFVLTESLDFWIEQKRRGIWFRVYTSESEWVPALVRVSLFV